MNRRICLLFAALAAAYVSLAEKLPPLPSGAFTYVVIPDTQRYQGEGSKVRPGEEPQTGPTRNASFESRIDWILANREKENIVFVSHVGDITDIHSKQQWAFASNLMARLDGRVPYGISPGNHDLEVCTSDGFNRSFPRSRYAQEPWYAGAFDGYVRTDGQRVSGGNANSCQLFESGDMKFVVLHLECNAPAPVLKWVDEMLERYADRKAIICTHMYLGYRTRALFCDRRNVLAYPDEWFGLLEWTKCHKNDGVSAVKAWKTCFSKHKNLLLIVSGDQGPAICWRETQKGVHGNTVFATMQDYPRNSDDSDWLRLYRFRPDLKRIEVWTYSPRQGKVCEKAGFRKGRDWHEFTLDYSQPQSAGLELVSPKLDETFCALKPEHRAFLTKDRAGRRAQFLNRKWRKRIVKADIATTPMPLKLEWRNGKGPYTVNVELDGATVFATNLMETSVNVWNLEIAREYVWTVCDGESCARGRFKTSDMAPRVMHVPNVTNVRDLGGRIGLNGRRVRQGLIYRSAGLNQNAHKYYSQKEVLTFYKEGSLEERFGDAGTKLKADIEKYKGDYKLDPYSHVLRKALIKEKCKGKSFLTHEGLHIANDILAWKSDIDLRSDTECWGMTGSPVGKKVKWFHYPAKAYGRIATDSGRKALTDIFKVFLDERNYPIVFHCIGGADRTGAVGFVLNALLGVSDEELDKDWEITCFKYESQDFGHRTRFDKLRAVFDSYPGTTIRERVEGFVKSLGFTNADIEKFRGLMLEPR